MYNILLYSYFYSINYVGDKLWQSHKIWFYDIFPLAAFGIKKIMLTSFCFIFIVPIEWHGEISEYVSHIDMHLFSYISKAAYT